MKDVNKVLEQKEADLARVQHEVESLRIVASLLEDDRDSNQSDQMHLVSAEKTDELDLNLAATGSDGPFSSVSTSRSTFWSALKREK